MVGMIIPVAYFATRAIEDVWLPRIGRRWRPVAACIFFPLIAVSQIMMLFLPVLPAITGSPQDVQGVFLERDYVGAFDWVEARSQQSDVILAAPLVSAWVPGWVGARVVYGHPYETLDADNKRQQVESWFNGSAADCSALIGQYNVRFVIYGPQEQRLGQTNCLSGLQEVAQSGRVSVYAP
jgi:hypothetical protein